MPSLGNSYEALLSKVVQLTKQGYSKNELLRVKLVASTMLGRKSKESKPTVSVLLYRLCHLNNQRPFYHFYKQTIHYFLFFSL